MMMPRIAVELMEQKGYRSEELPTSETLRKRLNELGFFPSKVGKTKPFNHCLPTTLCAFMASLLLNLSRVLLPKTLENFVA
jgi:hypothetical protein